MTSPARPLHLASASPRRCGLLAMLGFDFTHAGEHLDERPLPREGAADMVLRLAAAKAEAAAAGRPEVAVLGADTAVVAGERVFGKPASRTDGLDMLAALSGRTHEVVTAVALLADGAVRTALSTSRVTFRELDAGEAEAYWASGEPCDKAGAYAIQGLGGVFVAHLAGSCSGVIGLPLCETAVLLRRAGIDVWRQAAREPAT